MNPPISVAAHVEGRVRDAAMRHPASAFARLAEGGRLVAITGAGLSPEAPAWREDEAAGKRTSFFAHVLALTADVVFPSWKLFLESPTDFTIPPERPKTQKIE